MKLYHGTNYPGPILKGDMLAGTWLAGEVFHAYRIACRRVKQYGGEAVVICIEADGDCFERVVGRNLVTYRFVGCKDTLYKCISIFKMNEVLL